MEYFIEQTYTPLLEQTEIPTPTEDRTQELLSYLEWRVQTAMDDGIFVENDQQWIRTIKFLTISSSKISICDYSFTEEGFLRSIVLNQTS